MLIKIVNDLKDIGNGIAALADLCQIAMELIQRIKDGGKNEQDQNAEGRR